MTNSPNILLSSLVCPKAITKLQYGVLEDRIHKDICEFCTKCLTPVEPTAVMIKTLLFYSNASPSEGAVVHRSLCKTLPMSLSTFANMLTIGYVNIPASYINVTT